MAILKGMVAGGHWILEDAFIRPPADIFTANNLCRDAGFQLLTLKTQEEYDILKQK